jgi:hypothetical protein
VRLAILVTLCLSVAACGSNDDSPTVIDGSSQQAYEQSLSAAKRDLGPKDRLKFEAALTEFKAHMFAKAGTRQEYGRLVRQGMDGLTAPAIVEQFNKDVDRVSGKAADAVFDAKRALKFGTSAP